MSRPRYREPTEDAATSSAAPSVWNRRVKSNNWDGPGSLDGGDATATEGYLLDPGTGIAQFSKLYVLGQSVSAGLIVQSRKESSQAGISGVVDLTSLSVTFTGYAARTYKLSGLVVMTKQASRANVTVTITTSADGILATATNTLEANDAATFNLFALVSPGAGSVTYKMRAAATGGTATAFASSSTPGLFFAEDIGA